MTKKSPSLEGYELNVQIEEAIDALQNDDISCFYLVTSTDDYRIECLTGYDVNNLNQKEVSSATMAMLTFHFTSVANASGMSLEHVANNVRRLATMEASQ